MLKVLLYRKKAHKTQKQLADLIGVKAQSYSFKENGKRPFKMQEMKKIRDYLSDELGENLTIDELFF